MSNCFSLTTAEPFFNLLTARKQEEETKEEQERKGWKDVALMKSLRYYQA